MTDTRDPDAEEELPHPAPLDAKQDGKPKPLVQGSAEWEALLRSLSMDCGISLSIESTSRENLYGDDMR